MTKKLESLLDLPENKPITKKQSKELDTVRFEKEPFFTPLKELDKIRASMPIVRGLGDAADDEFDELTKLATEAYEDLMSLGMNVESRYSGRIFEVAGNMLKSAIEAKTAKINTKLKVIDMQLKSERVAQLDKPAPVAPAPAPDVVEAPVQQETYIITDRNSLLEKIRRMNEQ